MSVPTGLSEREWQRIREVLRQAPWVQRVSVFGSRATGHHRPASDVDFAVEGSTDVRALATLTAALNDLNLPYQVDVVSLDLPLAPALRDAITRDGILVFQRTEKSRRIRGQGASQG